MRGLGSGFGLENGSGDLCLKQMEILKSLLNEYIQIILKVFFFVFILLVSDVPCRLQSPGSGPNFNGSGLVFCIQLIYATSDTKCMKTKKMLLKVSKIFASKPSFEVQRPGSVFQAKTGSSSLVLSRIHYNTLNTKFVFVIEFSSLWT